MCFSGCHIRTCPSALHDGLAPPTAKMMASVVASGNKGRALRLKGVDPETCMIVFKNHWAQVTLSLFSSLSFSISLFLPLFLSQVILSVSFSSVHCPLFCVCLEELISEWDH